MCAHICRDMCGREREQAARCIDMHTDLCADMCIDMRGREREEAALKQVAELQVRMIYIWARDKIRITYVWPNSLCMANV